MREIKFRVWDVPAKRFDRDSRHLSMDLDGNTVNLQTGAGGAEHILEQYTGIKDKNGTEIWEGDIVKVKREDSFSQYNEAVIVYADNYGGFLLRYTKSVPSNSILVKIGENLSTDKKTLFGEIAYWELEKIGNIHETKETVKTGP